MLNKAILSAFLVAYVATCITILLYTSLYKKLSAKQRDLGNL